MVPLHCVQQGSPFHKRVLGTVAALPLATVAHISSEARGAWTADQRSLRFKSEETADFWLEVVVEGKEGEKKGIWKEIDLSKLVRSL